MSNSNLREEANLQCLLDKMNKSHGEEITYNILGWTDLHWQIMNERKILMVQDIRNCQVKVLSNQM